MKEDVNKLREVVKEAKDSIYESSLSRIWQHIQDPSRSFGVVSAFRGEYGRRENEQRHDELKDQVRELGYGYIELEGGYKEESGFVEELSLFIPEIRRNDLIELGSYYDQYSVIYKDRNVFEEIGTSEVAGVGRIIRNFKKEAEDKNISMNPEIIEEFFSALLKGSHRGRKFVFTAE